MSESYPLPPDLENELRNADMAWRKAGYPTNPRAMDKYINPALDKLLEYMQLVEMEEQWK